MRCRNSCAAEGFRARIFGIRLTHWNQGPCGVSAGSGTLFPMAVPPASVSHESDPERTAELPALDPAAHPPEPGEPPAASRTDTWVAPGPIRPEGAESPPAQALEATLRETQARLPAKAERLAHVERAREHAQ